MLIIIVRCVLMIMAADGYDDSDDTDNRDADADDENDDDIRACRTSRWSQTEALGTCAHTCGEARGYVT